MRVWLGVGLVVAALVIVGGASGQDALTQQDRRGGVTVAVTLAESPKIGLPIRATVILDTHAVALGDVVFDRTVILRTPSGAEITPAAVEASKGGGHHREAIVVFAPLSEQGTMSIIVKNVGGIGERSYVWTLSAMQ